MEEQPSPQGPAAVKRPAPGLALKSGGVDAALEVGSQALAGLQQGPHLKGGSTPCDPDSLRAYFAIR